MVVKRKATSIVLTPLLRPSSTQHSRAIKGPPIVSSGPHSQAAPQLPFSDRIQLTMAGLLRALDIPPLRLPFVNELVLTMLKQPAIYEMSIGSCRTTM